MGRFFTCLGAAALLFLATVAMQFIVPTELCAQSYRSAPDSLRLIQSVVPRSGPVGTRVKIYTENLPVQARIHVGVGATHDGFEALAEATQGEWGEIAATVTIPPTVTPERPLVFIVFNGIFSPLGISEPFHVTDIEGRLVRRGEVVSNDGSCLSFRDDDDYVYGLRGETVGLEPGQRARVVATFEGRGACGELDTLHVSQVDRP